MSGRLLANLPKLADAAATALTRAAGTPALGQGAAQLAHGIPPGPAEPPAPRAHHPPYPPGRSGAGNAQLLLRQNARAFSTAVPDGTRTEAAHTAGLSPAQAKQALVTEVLDKIGSDFKNSPLRTAYEAQVTGLKDVAEKMLKEGKSPEETAHAVWHMRREIGQDFKNLTPAPLLDFIHERNEATYGDKLGPTFEALVAKNERNLLDPYASIIASSARHNVDINKLLAGFKPWLEQKEPAYLENALKLLGK